MDVFINNKTVSLPEDASVSIALSHANIVAQRGVAVAVNNTVIPNSEWEKYTLKERDNVIVIKATQGG